MTRRFLARTALAALVLSAFAACAASPAPTQPPTTTPSPSATPTPSPTPSPEPPSAAAVVMSTEHLEVVDESGEVLASYDYFQPTAEVVDGLTAYLGTPDVSTFEGRNDVPPSTRYDWGGLRLTDPDYAGSFPTFAEHWVRFTSTDANGISLRAFDGTAVGDPISTIDGEIVDHTDPETGVVSRFVRIDPVPLPPSEIDQLGNDGTELNYAVGIYGDLTADVVEHLTAPSGNFGA